MSGTREVVLLAVHNRNDNYDPRGLAVAEAVRECRETILASATAVARSVAIAAGASVSEIDTSVARAAAIAGRSTITAIIISSEAEYEPPADSTIVVPIYKVNLSGGRRWTRVLNTDPCAPSWALKFATSPWGIGIGSIHDRGGRLRKGLVMSLARHLMNSLPTLYGKVPRRERPNRHDRKRLRRHARSRDLPSHSRRQQHSTR